MINKDFIVFKKGIITYSFSRRSIFANGSKLTKTNPCRKIFKCYSSCVIQYRKSKDTKLKLSKKCIKCSCLTHQSSLIEKSFHCIKSVRFRSYSGPHFPVFGLNTESYGVSLRIQSKYGKMRTRTTPNADTFRAVFLAVFQKIL